MSDVPLAPATTGLSEDTLGRLPSPAPFVRTLRDQGLAAYHALPTPSQETEEWRYTDVSDLDLDSFTPYAEGRRAENLDGLDPDLLAAAGNPGERAGLAVQHNSVLATAHLEPGLAAKGVLFTGLDEALASHPGILEPRLHQLVGPERSRFTALHAAARTGGFFVYVPKGVEVALPLSTLTYVDADGAAVFPHTVVVTEEGAEVTLIERYVSPDLGRALSDAVVEIFAGPNSRIGYVVLQEWGSGVQHFAVQRAQLERDAELRSLSVAFGGSRARAEIECVLEGDGASSEMLGLYFGDGDQHIDHRSIQDHVGSRTSSDLLYKGALKGHSRAVYTGTVIVEKGAHRCDAYQTNRNILLSETAKAQSVPNLEILTNDPTRCGHAASVGPVDEDQLFYLQTRGIARREAERLIVFGFFQEVLDRVSLPEIRDGLSHAIELELAREA